MRHPYFRVLAILLAPLLLSARPTEPPSKGEKIFARLQPLVFKVRTAISAEANKSSYGTGFVVDRRGVLATNFHVVAEALHQPKKYGIFVAIDGQQLAAQILRVDLQNDLALIKIAKPFTRVIPLARELPKQGNSTFSLGFPEDLNMTIVNGTYNEIINYGTYASLHLSTPINSGMSGGPTVNEAGEVVGVNVSRYVDANNISFAVPVARLSKLLNSLDSLNSVETAPSSEKMRQAMLDQLNLIQESLTQDILRAAQQQRVFAGFRIPQLPSYATCWTDKKDNTQSTSPFDAVSEQCHLNASAYLAEQLGSVGSFYFDIQAVKRGTLNVFQFLDLISSFFEEHLHDENFQQLVEEDSPVLLSPAHCHFEEMSGQSHLLLRVEVCLQGYVDYSGLYDAQLKIVTPARGQESLVFKGVFKAFRRENIKRILKQMVTQVGV